MPMVNMSLAFTHPVPYAIAFGGVLIGNMKSQLAASVTGIAHAAGEIPLA